MELRDRIAKLIDNELSGFGSYSIALQTAEFTLALPEIKEALELRQSALRRYGEAIRPMSAEAMYGAGLANAYANSSPLEQFVTRDDLTPDP